LGVQTVQQIKRARVVQSVATVELDSTPLVANQVAKTVQQVSLVQVELEPHAVLESTPLMAHLLVQHARRVNSAPTQPAPPKPTVLLELTQLPVRRVVSPVRRDPNAQAVSFRHAQQIPTL